MACGICPWLAIFIFLFGGADQKLVRDDHHGCLLVFAYYYPQFHPMPENQLEGFPENFTEWDLIKAAPDLNVYGKPIKKPITAPSYLYPKLGYYDLRETAVRAQQGMLARDFSIDGFFVYHYWLNNRVVMGTVIEEMLKDGQPNVSFALCWANEDWGNAYGFKRRELLEQRYDAPESHADYLMHVFQSPNYLHINGRPAIAVYVPSAVPLDYIDQLQNAVFNVTGKNIFFIASAMVYKNPGSPYAVQPGYDALMEFTPNLWKSPDKVLDPELKFPKCKRGSPHGYQPWFAKHSTTELPVWRGGLSGWDPTPRYPNSSVPKGGTEDCDLSPHNFQFATAQRIRGALCESGGMPSIYVIFAWNEWGEGAVLEPNTATGNSLLEGLAHAKLHGHRMFLNDAKEGKCSLLHKTVYNFSIHGGQTSLVPPMCMAPRIAQV